MTKSNGNLSNREQDIVRAAEEAVQFFHYSNTADKPVLVLKNDTPDWIRDMVREAHDGMFPDDYKYEFVYEILCHMSDGTIGDQLYDYIEPDTYTYDLLKWVASSLTRMEYVDDAVGDYGYSDLATALAGGQLYEKQEICYAVEGCIDKYLDLTSELRYNEDDE